MCDKTREACADTRGYTILELLMVISIVGILATLAEPMWEQSVTKAREAVLQRTLMTVRDVLDQFRADRGKYPANIREVVAAGYLRQVPVDPITKSSTTWQEIPAEAEDGIGDVRSGSLFVGSNGAPYNQW